MWFVWNWIFAEMSILKSYVVWGLVELKIALITQQILSTRAIPSTHSMSNISVLDMNDDELFKPHWYWNYRTGSNIKLISEHLCEILER